MNQSQRDKLIALAATAVIVILIVTALVGLYFRVNISRLEERKWPPVDSSEILFAGEYVEVGDIPLPSQALDPSPAPPSANPDLKVDGTDLSSAGEPNASSSQVVSTSRPSTMQVEQRPKPEKTGPTKEEIAERERIKREAEQAEQQAKMNDRMKSGFNKSTTGSGSSGAPNGNASTGALAGSPGHDLRGRTAESWGRPSSSLSGVIKIKVSVNRQGRVVGNPEYIGGSGPAAASSAVRNSCIAATRQSRFSIDNEAPAEQTGVITWRFE